MRHETIWAVVDDDGGIVSTGIVNADTKETTWFPLVTVQEKTARGIMRDAALAILANEPGKVLKLVRFTQREDVEVIGANG